LAADISRAKVPSWISRRETRPAMREWSTSTSDEAPLRVSDPYCDVRESGIVHLAHHGPLADLLTGVRELAER